jgi:catechol 2,3-dioxygenase-like lactoylglutathione lyase family enzyme
MRGYTFLPFPAMEFPVVYLLVDDVDGLHEELLRKKVRIDLEPTDQTWGNREMYVKDPDGNSIRFIRPSGG